MQAEHSPVALTLPALDVQRVLEPALVAIVERAEVVESDVHRGRSFFAWAAQTGHRLLHDVRREASGRAAWEQVQLRLDADGLGIVAYSLNALRHDAQRGQIPNGFQRHLIDQTRRDFWMHVPLTASLTCFLPHAATESCLLPRLHLLGSAAFDDRSVQPNNGPSWAMDLLSRLQRALAEPADAGAGLLLVRLPLATLIELHRLLDHWHPDIREPVTQIQQLRDAVARVLDPLVVGRMTGTASATAHARAAATASSIPVAPRGELAPLDRRFVAYLIDAVVSVIGVLLAAFSAGLLAVLVDPTVSDATLEDLGVVIGYAVYSGYFVLTTAYLGGTPGKRLLGLRVVDDFGERPGLARSFARYLVMVVLSIFALTWWWVLFRKDRRALHDLASGLWVVYEPTSRR